MNDSSITDFRGYRNPALSVLKRNGVRVWSDVRIETVDGPFEGLVMPRAERDNPFHIVIKLADGYNVGIHVDKITSITETGYRQAQYRVPDKAFPRGGDKPKVTLLGTGGTIASRLDYRTGAVIPAFSPGELYSAVPELAEIADLTTKEIYSVFSENVTAEVWLGTAREIEKVIQDGADGVVIGHGTDAMHYTAAALTYMVQDSPVPIVMVGSQRSSDRPSSDAALNLIDATYAAGHGDIAEVLVCMFGPTSDQYSLLHRGARVRKMHSSYRSTFRTISDTPVATVQKGGISYIKTDYRKRDPRRAVKIDAVFDERVSLLYYYPNMRPDMIDGLVANGYKGIVIAGTGLGHVNKPLFPALKRAIDAGVHVYMTVQTLWGFVQMYVYDTGRDMMDMGVIPCGNLIPEAAYVKLGWALGHTHDRDEVRKLMLTPVGDDLTDREPIDGYLVMQGGLPEIEQFLLKHRR
ncbi:Glu-tRNA(Gln) amidotransferase subunit GatD [bacterium]|nr:Glu-tRNA(Gln) amidotransferase subunit GatD [bacterium]